MPSDQESYKQAAQFYQAGDFFNAEKTLRAVLKDNPRHAQSLHLLGIIAMDTKNYEAAEELVNLAIVEQDNVAHFYFTLGRLFIRQEKKEEAVKLYEKALALKPDFTDALNNLGTTLLSLDRDKEASAIFKRLLKENPDNLNALCNTASILYKEEKYDEALEYYLRAVGFDPTSATLHYDIGRALRFSNRPDEALVSLKKAIHYAPDHVEALLSIADILRDKEMFDDAIAYYQRVKKVRFHEDASANISEIYLKQWRNAEALIEAEYAVRNVPDSIQSVRNLAVIYDLLGRFQEALDCYDKLLRLDPDNGGVWANMATTLKNLGRTDEAIIMQKKALSFASDEEQAWIYSNLLLTMVYSASVSPEEFAAVAREFGEKIADPLLRTRPFTNDKNPERKLRVGYVSPDFNTHSVSYFLSPIFMRDKDKFEIYGYSRTRNEDATTDEIKKKFDHWRDIKRSTDDGAADLIEADQIDILVDVAGHTGSNGLMIFARKPAPVQITWLGYPATSGMKAMDYRITDSYAEPVGMTEHLNTETLWRLPQIFCVYKPGENSPSVLDHPPFHDNGHVTFGCFNNFTRVTDPTLAAWAEIMGKVSNSRLLLEIAGIDSEKIRSEIEARLARMGLPMERVILEPRKKANQYVLYNKIDIALDPFPCVGGTTSMDTLWMGVPLVTLAGNSFLSRIGVSILSNAGLPQLIAQNIEEYILIATDLARDHSKLQELRHNLRDRTIASPLMNQEAFIRNMEEGYRAMWKLWIAKSSDH